MFDETTLRFCYFFVYQITQLYEYILFFWWVNLTFNCFCWMCPTRERMDVPCSLRVEKFAHLCESFILHCWLGGLTEGQSLILMVQIIFMTRISTTNEQASWSLGYIILKPGFTMELTHCPLKTLVSVGTLVNILRMWNNFLCGINSLPVVIIRCQIHWNSVCFASITAWLVVERC